VESPKAQRAARPIAATTDIIVQGMQDAQANHENHPYVNYRHKMCAPTLQVSLPLLSHAPLAQTLAQQGEWRQGFTYD
jgi:hypothetical protein